MLDLFDNKRGTGHEVFQHGPTFPKWSMDHTPKTIFVSDLCDGLDGCVVEQHGDLVVVTEAVLETHDPLFTSRGAHSSMSLRSHSKHLTLLRKWLSLST